MVPSETTTPPPPVEKDSKKHQLSSLPRITPSLAIEELRHELDHRQKNHVHENIARDDDDSSSKEWYVNKLGNGSIWETSSIAKNMYYLSSETATPQEEVDCEVNDTEEANKANQKAKEENTNTTNETKTKVTEDEDVGQASKQKTSTTIQTPSRRSSRRPTRKGGDEKSTAKVVPSDERNAQDKALVGEKLAKYFFNDESKKMEAYIGTVKSVRCGTKRAPAIFSIVYEDGDSEEMFNDEVTKGIKLHEKQKKRAQSTRKSKRKRSKLE